MPTLGVEPEALDVRFYAGDDWRVTLEFDDGEEPPAALNMAGWTEWAAHVKARSGDVAALVTITVDTTDAASGVIVLEVAGDDLYALFPTPETKTTWAGVWDLEALTPTGKRKTLYAGAASARYDVTRQS